MHGLSTLNRLLGKKNKEVSRSTSNLSKSHSNLESSSQHNKKIPILNNAPFEQTFRVTVYLPKNQLYVERIGAKTKLEKLMNDVCDNKNLSIDKYEFRHPADMSQVFDNDKTIGEVGLNELRLVLKSESRYNGDFHRYHSRPDDIIKYKSSSNVAESVSSSEISRTNLKNTSKTSPYSSTNSLNSLDSTGMNSSTKVQQPVAPIRKKKRAAPRPPSENSIPEQEIFNTTTLNVFKEPHSILPRKNFHVSSPQLYNSNNINNNYEIAQKSDSNNNNTELRSISSRLNAITRPSSLHFGSNTEIVKNLPERQRNNSESSEIQNIMQDSGSMQNSLERAKKKSPAPVPPTRKVKPTPSPRTIQEDMKSITEIKEVDEHEQNVSTQKIVGEIPVDKNSNNKTDTIIKSSSNSSGGGVISSKTEDENGNVSKVLLNNKLEKTEGPISIQILSSEVSAESQTQQEEKSKESMKLPVVSKVNINNRGDETRSGSDEEEEEMTVNIYNVTKSVVTCEKSAIIKERDAEQKHVIIENNNNNIVKEETSNVTKVEECQRSPSPEWTYTLPAPPIVGNSLDSNNSNVNNNNNSPTDQKSVVGNKYFSDYTSTVNDNETILSDSNTTVVSAETHIQPIINDRRKVLDDSFIMNPNDYTKPSTNAAILDNQSDKSTEIITSDLEDGYLGNNKENNISNDNEISIIEEVLSKPKPPIEDIQRSRLIAITRSDSFHSIGQQKRNEYYDGMIRGTNFNAQLPQRSTSFLSLVHSQKIEMRSSSLTTTTPIKQDLNVPYNRQKSTSELSISDVPSLQSLEVIKNILNCRKSSLQDVNHNNNSALSDDINNDYKSAVPIEEPKSTLIEATTLTSTTTSSAVATAASKIEVKSTEKVIYNTIEKRDIKKLETQKSEPVIVERNKNNDTSNNNVKKSETQWRYSGPPKINFSTWNERPKVEVSVMSDEDYIFGGSAHSTTLPRDFKNQGINQYSQNQSVDSVDSYVKKSYSTVMVKNENKEAERHLPKVLGVEYKKDVVVLRNNNNSNSNKDTTPASSTTSEINNGNNSTTKTLISIKQRPVTMDYSSAISTTTKTTLNSPNYQNHQFVSFNNNNNNINSNSKKFTPIVHGFSKLDNISETQSDVKSLPITNNKIIDANNEKRPEAPMIPVKPSYLRSTSATSGDINRNIKLSSVKNVGNANNNAGNDVYDENPYSSTLRRTGLIEKMLNNDKKTESIFGRVLDKPKSTATNPSVNKPVQMNEDKVEKVTIRQLSQPVTSTNNISVPPPPPPMMFRKSAPVVISGQHMSEADTRNELLDAIKNFNKDSLRRK